MESGLPITRTTPSEAVSVPSLIPSDYLQNRLRLPSQLTSLICQIATVHEPCTTMNTLDVHADGAFCAYWTDGVGDKFTGSKCIHFSG